MLNVHLSEGARPLNLAHRGEGILGIRLFSEENITILKRNVFRGEWTPFWKGMFSEESDHHFEKQCSPGLGRRCFWGREWTLVFDDLDPPLLVSDSVLGSGPAGENFQTDFQTDLKILESSCLSTCCWFWFEKVQKVCRPAAAGQLPLLRWGWSIRRAQALPFELGPDSHLSDTVARGYRIQ